MVTIEHICGSERRAHDFDIDFNPIQENTRARWLKIANALQPGIELPTTTLIQIVEQYSVRGGYHRISVTQTQRKKVILTKVEVWRLQKYEDP